MIRPTPEVRPVMTLPRNGRPAGGKPVPAGHSLSPNPLDEPNGFHLGGDTVPNA